MLLHVPYPSSAVPFLPANGITWKVLGSSAVLFCWSSVNTNCPAVHYNILSSNCGSCPMNTTNATVTCNDVLNEADNSQVGMCSFAVQTVMCGNITGTISDIVTVPLSIIQGTSNSLFTDSKKWSNVTMIQGMYWMSTNMTLCFSGCIIIIIHVNKLSLYRKIPSSVFHQARSKL